MWDKLGLGLMKEEEYRRGDSRRLFVKFGYLTKLLIRINLSIIDPAEIHVIKQAYA